MRRTMIATTVAALLCVSLVGVPAGAVGGPQSPVISSQTITGWTGTDPTPISLGPDYPASTTAVFTTTTGQTDGLWVSSRTSSDTFAPATSVADDVVPGTVATASNAAGDTVVAWDSSAHSVVTAYAAVRTENADTLEDPTPIASDPAGAGFTHQLSAGIDDSGYATVGFVHHTETGALASFAVREDLGRWSSAVTQSTGAVGQERLAVSAIGTVTMAWTQHRGTGVGEPTEMFVRRFLPDYEGSSDGVWQARQDVFAPSGSGVDLQLVDIVTSLGGLSAIAVADHDRMSSGPRVREFVVRSDDGLSPTPCVPSCAWVHNQIGGSSRAAAPIRLAVDDLNTTRVATVHTAAGGDARITAVLSNGKTFDHGFTTASTGRTSAITVAGLNGRYLLGWHSTSDGGVARVRGDWSEIGESPHPDTQSITLGRSTHAPALSVANYATGEAFWQDDSEATPVLRVTLLGRPEEPWLAHEWFSHTSMTSVNIPTRLPLVLGLRYDVRVKRAGLRNGFGHPFLWVHDQAATPAHYRAARGQTVCFSYRTRTAYQGVSAWEPYTCAAAPVDASALTASRGWTIHHDKHAFAGTLSVSRTHGATLTIRDVTGYTIALLIDRRDRSGAISFRFGHQNPTIEHLSGSPHERAIAPAEYGFRHNHTGTLRIRVVSHGKPVLIDGVIISRLPGR